MSWELILILFFLVFTAQQVIQKSIVNRLPIAKSLFLQFLGASLIMIVYTLAFGRFQFEWFLLLISSVALLNAWAAYFQFRATHYSLSKTVLFLSFPGVITVGLAAIFLGEKTIYNPQIILGSALLFSAAIFLSKREAEENGKFNLRWLLFILGMVLLQGFAVFMTKYFSASISRSTFLLYWYTGSFLGTLPVLLMERIDKRAFLQKGSWRIPLASLGMVVSYGLAYSAFQITPAAVIEPIRRFGMVLFPMLAGWFLFNERKGLFRVHLLGITLGIAGVLLVISGTY